MFEQVLTFLFSLFLAFAACHYSLKQVVSNSTAVLVSSAIFAVLVAIFVTLQVG